MHHLLGEARGDFDLWQPCGLICPVTTEPVESISTNDPVYLAQCAFVTAPLDAKLFKRR